MNYEETLEYLYKQLPVFQQIGSAAINRDYKIPKRWTNISDIPIESFTPYMLPGPTVRDRYRIY